MTIENNKKTDVSKESSEDKSLPNIDRIALLSDTTSGANVRSLDKILLGKEFNPLGYKPSASEEDGNKSAVDKSYPGNNNPEKSTTENSDKNTGDKKNSDKLSNVKIEYATIPGLYRRRSKETDCSLFGFFCRRTCADRRDRTSQPWLYQPIGGRCTWIQYNRYPAKGTGR